VATPLGRVLDAPPDQAARNTITVLKLVPSTWYA
jgi:hypothetical protein